MGTHGIDSTYHTGCRCDECREAHRLEWVAWSHRSGRSKPRAEYHAELRDRFDTHGREARYGRGCRCDECREAARVARAKRRAKAAA